MPEPREAAPDLLPDVFNAFPMALRKVGDGQPLIDALAEILPAYDAAKEREVRAKVAEEARAEFERKRGDLFHRAGGPFVDDRAISAELGAYRNAITIVARIARGEQP